MGDLEEQKFRKVFLINIVETQKQIWIVYLSQELVLAYILVHAKGIKIRRK